VSSPNDPTVETNGEPGVHLSIDEATVLLGLLDLLRPSSGGDQAIDALAERSRTRLAAAIAESLCAIRALRAL
jgi:hypothetical protein